MRQKNSGVFVLLWKCCPVWIKAASVYRQQWLLPSFCGVSELYDTSHSTSSHLFSLWKESRLFLKSVKMLRPCKKRCPLAVGRQMSEITEMKSQGLEFSQWANSSGYLFGPRKRNGVGEFYHCHVADHTTVWCNSFQWAFHHITHWTDKGRLKEIHCFAFTLPRHSHGRVQFNLWILKKEVAC